jgi:hypothetical protein
MSKYTEGTLNTWRKPASENEEQKISNAMSMIKSAINDHPQLLGMNTEAIVQGSYANNTNVKLDSDIDVAIMFKDAFYSEYPEGLTRDDYGFSKRSIEFSDYRRCVIQAIGSKFGTGNVHVGNKSIRIQSNTYHVQADVVPSFQYRNYRYISSKDPDVFVEGIKFYSGDGKSVVNYPKVHISNGIAKNKITSRRYKRGVRLLKRIRNKMIEEGVSVSSAITSFLIESLLCNIPDRIYNNTDTWNDLLRACILYLYGETKDPEKSKNWGEVSDLFYLFHDGRKWDRDGTKAFLAQSWDFLGYANE